MKKYILTLLAITAVSAPSYAQVDDGVSTGLSPNAIGLDSSIGVGSNTGSRILSTTDSGVIPSDIAAADVHNNNEKSDKSSDKVHIKHDKNDASGGSKADAGTDAAPASSDNNSSN